MMNAYTSSILAIGHRQIELKLFGSSPTWLMLHGAGNSNQNRLRPQVEYLRRQYNISVITLDFPGQEEGGVGLINSGSSLRERLEITKAVISKYPQIHTVVGFSMSGHTAVHLTKYFTTIGKLVLFSPAMYADKAFEISFGEKFSTILRTSKSYRQSPITQKILSEFTGEVILVRPTEDKVIPAEVFEIYKDNSNYYREIIVNGGEHTLANWLQNNPKYIPLVYDKVFNFTDLQIFI
jgi:hypothetical protein